MKKDGVRSDVNKEDDFFSVKNECGFVSADLEKTGQGQTSLTAECPICEISDAFCSTGEHNESGTDVVFCSNCGVAFQIEW